MRPETPDGEPAADERVAVGRVLGAHGVRGELRVEPLTDDPRRFRKLATLSVAGQAHSILSVRISKDLLLLRLEGVETRDAASALRGEYLYIPLSEAAELPDGAYYHFQLLGLRVRTTEGREIGKVVEVLERPANDVYVVRGPDGDVLVPALKEVVDSIDIQEGWMTVQPVPGLLSVEEE